MKLIESEIFFLSKHKVNLLLYGILLTGAFFEILFMLPIENNYDMKDNSM